MLLRHRYRYLSPDPDLEGGGSPPAALPPLKEVGNGV